MEDLNLTFKGKAVGPVFKAFEEGKDVVLTVTCRPVVFIQHLDWTGSVTFEVKGYVSKVVAREP